MKMNPVPVVKKYSQRTIFVRDPRIPHRPTELRASVLPIIARKKNQFFFRPKSPHYSTVSTTILKNCSMASTYGMYVNNVTTHIVATSSLCHQRPHDPNKHHRRAHNITNAPTTSGRTIGRGGSFKHIDKLFLIPEPRAGLPSRVLVSPR